ncbi:MAG: choice-of-anchor D domain-containing protein [Alphaproteobacteria bacterium]|nr:choice-of-anchor D domain-containing protein [Alphaproteobacteria bacterium]
MRLVPFLALTLMACQEYDLAGKIEDPPPPPPVLEPDIEVAESSLDFGTQPGLCPTQQSVEVRNVGEAPLVITALVVGTTQYAVLGGPTELAPGDAADVTIGLQPDSTTVFTDTLSIHSNDPDEPVVDVTLSGEVSDGGFVEEVYDQLGAAVPVDILFVVDNSTSMGDENLALRNNFNAFIQGFLTLGLDFQIGVVTTDMQTAGYAGQIQGPIIDSNTPDPVQQFQQNTNIPFTDVLEEQGLDAVYAALTPPLITGANAGLVRPGSLLSVIVISDEDDQSFITPAEMVPFLDSYQGDPALTSLSIVGGPTTGIWPCGGFLFGAAPVPTYWQVAQPTGGIHLNLCQLNMNAIVQQLAVVAAGLDTHFPLGSVPADPAAVEVLIDGTPLAQDPVNGWSYDPSTNSVVFAGAGIPPAGSEIRVRIPVDSSCP